MTTKPQSKCNPVFEQPHAYQLHGEAGRINGLTFGRDHVTESLCDICMTELIEGLRDNDFATFALMRSIFSTMAVVPS